MNRRRFAILFAGLAGILVYWQEWFTLLGLAPFPEATFFDGFPNPRSAVPGVALVLGFALREYPYAAWAAFFLPSLVAHHAVMLVSAGGFFNLWPAFVGAHLLLLAGALALVVLGAWMGRRFHAAAPAG